MNTLVAPEAATAVARSAVWRRSPGAKGILTTRLVVAALYDLKRFQTSVVSRRSQWRQSRTMMMQPPATTALFLLAVWDRFFGR
jgi:hypothetical protein